MKSTNDTRHYLLPGLPLSVAIKLKVAASMQNVTMREYMLQVLKVHIKELEKKGVSLGLLKWREMLHH